MQTIAFYNVENLFDVFDDTKVHDEDFVPTSDKYWTNERYQKKINNIATVLANIGQEETLQMPILIGLAEIENRKVLEDLTQSNLLKKEKYNIAHFNSKDERGVDVALLYKNDFTLISQEAIFIPLQNEDGSEDFTRDILYVSGHLKNVLLHVFVVHFPSKREGDINQPKRKKVAEKLREKIDEILALDTNAYVFCMGDFNENPNEENIKNILKTTPFAQKIKNTELYNPMEIMHREGKGTLSFQRQWNLFDQMLFSPVFAHKLPKIKIEKVAIFNPTFIADWSGYNKGEPYRTYAGKKYLGGFSDHFPIYTVINI